MRQTLRISGITAAFLLLCVSTDTASAQDRERTRGSFGPHLAVGSVNGFRLGLRYFLDPSLALEAAGGYVQVTLLREEQRKEYTDGWSATVGGSYFTHPDATITPLVSLLAVYMASAVLPDGFSQRRIAIVPSLGSEYYFHDRFSVFFRFGPAFQFTTEQGETHFETTTQFDAGISYLL
jgi:hypothetical protein